ncbi:MAG: hypothetical protein HDR21_12065 [Lachnospiraceae bacterium]|nr:hypothetical protein [Lachnospiraceae bacterium]
MLGRTNTLFVEDQEDTSFELVQEPIVTASASSVEKIEFFNGFYFAFLGDWKILYGSDMNNLSIMMRDNTPFLASHVIYADDSFYFVYANKKFSQQKICKTTDFLSFEDVDVPEVEEYTAFGIYMTKAGRIVILMADEKISLHICITDTISESAQLNIIETSYNYKIGSSINSTYLKASKMINDKIILKEYAGSSTNTYMLICSLDGTVTNTHANNLSKYAHGCFYTATNSLTMYYSLNGIDFNKLGTVNGVTTGNLVNTFEVMELDDNAVGVIIHNTGNIDMFTIIETPTQPGNIFQNPKVISLFGSFLCYLYHDGFTYIGCTGGLILKTYVDYSGSSAAPNIKALKTLSAKQALEDAKKYTDERFKILASMIENMHTGKEE